MSSFFEIKIVQNPFVLYFAYSLCLLLNVILLASSPVVSMVFLWDLYMVSIGFYGISMVFL